MHIMRSFPVEELVEQVDAGATFTLILTLERGLDTFFFFRSNHSC